MQRRSENPDARRFKGQTSSRSNARGVELHLFRVAVVVEAEIRIGVGGGVAAVNVEEFVGTER